MLNVVPTAVDAAPSAEEIAILALGLRVALASVVFSLPVAILVAFGW